MSKWIFPPLCDQKSKIPIRDFFIFGMNVQNRIMHSRFSHKRHESVVFNVVGLTHECLEGSNTNGRYRFNVEQVTPIHHPSMQREIDQRASLPLFDLGSDAFD